ncbi:MAG: HAMP domain-containing histidine kinase [Gammaproteobacteria bacterium]|nr:HAMP domain-containing histidine kinase [Gammaproteobacteria bacterium]
METPSQQNFSAILASSIHDTKNSVGMVLLTLEEMLGDVNSDGLHCSSVEELAQLQYQTKRVSNNLMQLLALYRIENHSYSLQPQETYLTDFLDDCYALNAPLIESRGFMLELQCDSNLLGYFDTSLVSGVINNAITNAIRYTRSKLLLSCYETDGCIVIELNDDGEGFPDEMLLDKEEGSQSGINFIGGNTGLGIYFARIVAAMHRYNGRQGSLTLHNGGPLGGGLITLTLP